METFTIYDLFKGAFFNSARTAPNKKIIT